LRRPSSGPYPANPDVAARIRLARRESGLTKGKLAGLVGVRLWLIEAWELGAKGVSPEQLERLAVALNRPVEWLAEGRDPLQGLPAIAAELDELLQRLVEDIEPAPSGAKSSEVKPTGAPTQAEPRLTSDLLERVADENATAVGAIGEAAWTARDIVGWSESTPSADNSQNAASRAPEQTSRNRSAWLKSLYGILPALLFASVTLNLLVLRFAWEDGHGPSEVFSGGQDLTAPREFGTQAKNGAGDTRVPPQWRNCTTVNARYQHGVGKTGAHDRTKGDTEPVTDFMRSNTLYQLAKHLDRDHDGIACEEL
jgi:transcriptional regulator with XRE-family HTH domain